MNGTWIGTALALLGGGAMGALIKILYDLGRERRQSISSRVSIFSLFRQDRQFDDFEAVLSVTHNGLVSEFRTLFVADVMLRNGSNRDYSEFEFGISLGAGSECVHVGWENPDQHHVLSLLDAVSASETRSDMKFRLRPFNRKESYSLRLHLVPNSEGCKPTIKQLTSPHAVRFIDIPGPGDRSTKLALAAAAVALLATIGNFTLAVSSYLTFNQYRREVPKLDEKMLQLYSDCKSRQNSGKRKFEFDWQTLECVEMKVTSARPQESSPNPALTPDG